jgi:hypothetical protein
MACPPLLDRMMARTGFQQQISDTPEVPGRPDNLYQPVSAPVAARGRFGARSKPAALAVDSTHARIAAAAAGGLAVSLIAGAAYALGRRAG